MRAILGLAICGAGASAAFALETPAMKVLGLDAAFTSQALDQFKQMGYSMQVQVVDFDDPEMGFERFPASMKKAAIFSLVDGFGSNARCAIGVRASNSTRAPEARIAISAKALGGDYKEVWRTMFRHEMGHCALGYASLAKGAPDPFLSEPFADVFALDWSRRLGGEPAKAAGVFMQVRRKMGGGGSHATWPAIERWTQASPELSPCVSAWKNSPIDGRGPSEACPKPQ